MKKSLKFVLPILVFVGVIVAFALPSQPALRLITARASAGSEFSQTPVLLVLAEGQVPIEVTHNVYVREEECFTPIFHVWCQSCFRIQRGCARTVTPDMVRERNGERVLLAPTCTVPRHHEPGEFVRHWMVMVRSGEQETVRHVYDAPLTATTAIPSLRQMPFCGSDQPPP